MKSMKILFTFGLAWLFAGAPGFAADKEPVTDKSVSAESAKAPHVARIIRLDGTDVDLDRLEKESRRLISSPLGDVQRRETDRSGNEVEVRYKRRAKYFSQNKHVAVIESKVLSDEVFQGHLKVYRDDGTKIFETKVDPDKDGDYLDYEDVRVLGSHHVITIASKSIGENKSLLDIYDIASNEVIFSTPSEHIRSFQVSPDENYILLQYVDKEKYKATYKYDLWNRKNIKIMNNAVLLAFSNDGKSYILADWQKTEKNSLTGIESGITTFYLFGNDKLIWSNKTRPYETSVGGGESKYSKNNKYYIFGRHIEVKMKGNYIESYKAIYYIFDTSDGRIVAEGQLSQEIVEKYKNEMLLEGDKK